MSLCDYSGIWSRPYEEAGYLVIRVDLKHGHDVRLMEFPKQRIHGVIMAPPCTVFASSGARWERSREDMIEGLSVVDACLRYVAICNPQWWVLENPIGKLARYLGPPAMRFDPCDFGDPYTKRTCLWGTFTKPQPTKVTPTLGSKMHTQYGGKSERTKELRSATPEGFARAFFEANP